MSMDARLARLALIGAAFLLLGANYRTQHFLVTASTPDLAQEVGEHAERLRRDLALEWLGQELPPWHHLCPITVHVAPGKPAGGQTSFVFSNRVPGNWQMIVEGTRERVLDSVLPHEITHTVFATHFGQPLPRWADEGACTTVEHDAEKKKQERLLIQFLTTNRGIAFNQMFAMREYPADILPLYSQGYALARFLIAQGGKRKFVDYVGDGLNTNNWTHSTRKHYGFESLSELQLTWLDWVRDGSPLLADQSLPTTFVAASNHSSSSSSSQVAGGVAAPRVDQGSEAPPEPRAEPAGQSPRAPQGLIASVGHDRLENRGDDRGWYSRQRDQAYRARENGASDEPHEVPRRLAPPPRAQSSARPRGMEGARQTVLEWSRGGMLSDSGAGQLPTRSAGPSQLSDAGYRPGSTQLR